MIALLLYCGTAWSVDHQGWLEFQQEALPPALPWSGESRALALPPGDDWATPCERSHLKTTPRYAETIAWLDSLCAATPLAQMRSIGTSAEGRDIWMVVVSGEATFSPEELRRSAKPTLLTHAGIHSGEIDGKDAGMMLLRDLTVRGNLGELLDDANLLFIPILNVDGHERFSAFARINQRGPQQMGWRTNANNLNLNRDFAKLDTPGVRAVVRVIQDYDPDLYLDLHVTDGADYQYDITWGDNGAVPYSPSIAKWFTKVLNPELNKQLLAQGHIPGPLVFLEDGRNPDAGIVRWLAGPRFSSGYGDIRHLPTILVENHSLKPYDQRVLGTRVLLETALRVLGRSASDLRQATQEDKTRHQKTIGLNWIVGDGPYETIEFLSVKSTLQRSDISGDLRIVYLGEPETRHVPYRQMDTATHSVTRPQAYWIPAAWQDVIERLRMHGVQMEVLQEERDVVVEVYELMDPKLEEEPFEGRVRVSSSMATHSQKQRFGVGAVRIPMGQPLGELVALLLEPESADSFFQWGFFHAVLQRTEYSEAYVTEPLAAAMLAADPGLREEFEKKLLAEPAFVADAAARLRWFYERTPWFDQRWKRYPVARELE